MPTKVEIAGENLSILATYADMTYQALEKRSRAADGSEKTTRRNMRNFLIVNELANEKAPGHKSGKRGDKMQDGTAKWIKKVQDAMK